MPLALKLAAVTCIAFALAATPAVAQPPTAGGGAALAMPQSHVVGFAARGFRGGRGFGSRGRGFGRPHRGRGLFRSILRALAIGYLLHLLFTTPGGLMVLGLMILGVLLLMSRLRRRRAYRY
jgi:hypothetical protein